MPRYPKHLDTNVWKKMDEHQLQTHLARSRYGNFELPDGIRPHPGFTPMEAFRIDQGTRDEDGQPVISMHVSATKEKILPLLRAALNEFPEIIDLILESSNGHADYTDWVRIDVDRLVVESNIADDNIGDLLLNDGYAGITIVDSQRKVEVCLDEHKLFRIHAIQHSTLDPFLAILQSQGIPHVPLVKFIDEFPHVHSSGDYYAKILEALILEMGCERLD